MDIWAAGCILGEMLIRRVIFPGTRTAISQLSAIFVLTGTPSESNWIVQMTITLKKLINKKHKKMLKKDGKTSPFLL